MNAMALRSALEREILRAADRAALDMEAKAITMAPKGTSEAGIDKSIHGVGIMTGTTVRARLTCTAPHGRFIEEGTGPAVGHKKYMPPPDVLRQWIQRKLGLEGEELDRAEGSIRWAIREHGTKPQPFMKPAFDLIKKEWRNRLKAAVRVAARSVMGGPRAR